MSIQLAGEAPLSEVVRTNMRAEAARRGMSQAKLAVGLGMSRAAVSQRARGETPWTLDEVERAARLFGVRPADLLTRLPRLDSNQQPSDYRTRLPPLRLVKGVAA